MEVITTGIKILRQFLLFKVNLMRVKCLTGQTHLLIEGALGRHSLLHLLELLSLYRLNTTIDHLPS